MIFHTFARSAVTPLIRLTCRLQVEGVHNVARRGPLILASNHLSFIDSFVLPVAARRSVAFIGKAELFEAHSVKGRLRSAAFKAVGTIPVERGARHNALAPLQAAQNLLALGEAIGIYPEGSRSRDGRLYEGHPGAAWLSIRTGIPVVPVGLIGTDQVLPIGGRIPRFGRVIVQFGAPIDPTRYAYSNPATARRMYTDEIMSRIHFITGQEKAQGLNALSVGS